MGKSACFWSGLVLLCVLAPSVRADVGPRRNAPPPKCDPDKPGETCVIVDEGGGPLGGSESKGVCGRAPDGKAYCKLLDHCHESGTKKSIACPAGLVTEAPKVAEPAPPVPARSCSCGFEERSGGEVPCAALVALALLRRRRRSSADLQA